MSLTTRWAWTSDLPDDFFPAAKAVAKAIGCGEVFSLLGPMAYESGLRPGAVNADTGAVGLIQLLPVNLPAVRWTAGPEAFARLSAVEQLPYAQRYLERYKPLASVAHVYLAIFAPARLPDAGNPDAPLYSAASDLLRHSNAFALNAGLDADGDEVIQVRELVMAVKRACVGRRWAETVLRTGERVPAWLTPDPTDLSTPYGLQSALRRAGFDPGDIDGQMGPQTRAAVVAFQKAQGLDPDGRPGPQTRHALRRVLVALGL